MNIARKIAIVTGMVVSLGAISFAPSLRADARLSLLFSEAGRRLFPESPEASTAVRILPKLTSACSLDPARVCLNFKLELPDTIDETEVIGSITAALSVLTGSSELNLGFEYRGLFLDEGLPYVRDAGGEIVLDEFGNETLAGDFVISLDPPASVLSEFGTNEVARNLYYVVPNLSTKEGNLVWGGIYINPVFNPLLGCDATITPCFSISGFGNYSLRSIVFYQAGQLLGLAPSTIPSSLMFPMQATNILKNFVNIRSHEKNWLSDIYPGISTTPRGVIAGRVMNGDSGEGIPGAAVYLLPEASVEFFEVTSSMDLFLQSSFTHENGRFEFRGVPAGRYVVVTESLASRGFSPQILDDWLEKFAVTEYFSPDFYDGEDRESNVEPANFSPLLVRAAAKVIVSGGAETSPVQIYTQSSDENPTERVANGSSNEELSEFTFSDLNEQILGEIRTTLENEKSSKGGGCAISSGKSSGGVAMAIFFFLAGLCLWFRFQSDRIAKRHPVASR